MRLIIFIIGSCVLVLLPLPGMFYYVGVTIWALCVAATSANIWAVVGRFMLYIGCIVIMFNGSVI